MTGLFSVIVLLAIIALVAGLLMLIFQRLRGRGKVLAVGGAVALLGGMGGVMWSLNQDARSAGYDDVPDKVAAERAGITDPDAWRRHKAELAENERKAEAARQEEGRAAAAQAEAERRAATEQAEAEKRAVAARAEEEKRAVAAKREAEEEARRIEAAKAEEAKAAACRADLQCWGDKHSLKATFACRTHIESLAKIDFKWTDGWTGSKFSHFRWKDRKAGTLIYIGDQIQFQNGFGAWLRHRYFCDFDPTSNAALSVRAELGKL